MIKRLLTGVILSGLVGVAFGQSATGPLAVEDRPVNQPAKQDQSKQQASDEATMMLLEQLQQYEQELQQLRGMVESLQHEIDTMKEAQRERYLDLDSRINALAEASLEKAVKESGSDSAAAAGDAAADRAAYKEARKQLMGNDFQAAAGAFRRYLKEHPEGDFRPFAHFWLGVSIRNLPDGDNGEAAKHFRTVVSDYPDHSKVPAALYKLAAIQAERGERGEAKVTLNKILLKYPDSSEARLAKTMLMQLEQGGESQ